MSVTAEPLRLSHRPYSLIQPTTPFSMSVISSLGLRLDALETERINTVVPSRPATSMLIPLSRMWIDLYRWRGMSHWAASHRRVHRLFSLGLSSCRPRKAALRHARDAGIPTPVWCRLPSVIAGQPLRSARKYRQKLVMHRVALESE